MPPAVPKKTPQIRPVTVLFISEPTSCFNMRLIIKTSIQPTKPETKPPQLLRNIHAKSERSFSSRSLLSLKNIPQRPQNFELSGIRLSQLGQYIFSPFNIILLTVFYDSHYYKMRQTGKNCRKRKRFVCVNAEFV